MPTIDINRSIQEASGLYSRKKYNACIALCMKYFRRFRHYQHLRVLLLAAQVTGSKKRFIYYYYLGLQLFTDKMYEDFCTEEIYRQYNLIKKLPKLKKAVTLDVCMIMKNEARFLRQTLFWLSALADRIIILDTGSTDSSIKIAEKFGAEIHTCKWDHNFSTARNKLLSYAKSDWILMLDCDETISLSDQVKLVKSLETDSGIDAFSFKLRVYSKDQLQSNFIEKNDDNYFEARPYAGWLGGEIIKLYKNRHGFHYTRAVHETVLESIQQKKGKVCSLNIPIHNFGFEKGRRRKNQNYYYELINKELLSNPSPDTLFYAAKLALTIKGDKKKARRNLAELLKKCPAHIEAKKLLGQLCIQMQDYREGCSVLGELSLSDLNYEDKYTFGLGLLRLGEHKKAYVLFQLVTQERRNYVPALYQIAYLHYTNSDYESAMAMLKKILEIFPQHSGAKQRVIQLEKEMKQHEV